MTDIYDQDIAELDGTNVTVRHDQPDWEIMQGDSKVKLKDIPDNSVDSVVTDPPRVLSF